MTLRFISNEFSQFSVVRPKSDVFDEIFNYDEDFKFPAKDIFNFVIRNANVDSSHRTTRSTRSDGYQMDFGCAGRAFNDDPNNPGTYRPVTLYGTDVIVADADDGLLFRRFVGRIADACCRISDSISEQLRQPTSLNNLRHRQYGEHLCQFLFARYSYVEFVQIQLLNLSRGDKGDQHYDEFNDPRVSYNRVMCWVSVSKQCFQSMIKLYQSNLLTSN